MHHRSAKTTVLKTMVAAVLLAGLTALALASPALAAVRRHAAVPAGRITPMPAGATDPTKDAALIIDGETGKTLYARNELLERHPASLTKMMTLYLLFEALKNGKVTMQTQMPVSRHATVQIPTKLFLRPGQVLNVDTAIRAMVIRSANDAAVVVAEALGGTESHFAEMMTAKAHELGMKETNFHNASGVPDPLQITTASDLAILARHLAYDFPQYFSYFGTPGFTYNRLWIPTHDNLLGRYPGADGIKTGYVDASGFNIVTSVVRGDVHLIGVVMGGRTAVRRDLEMMHLMDTEFADIATVPALVAHAQVPWQTGVAVASAAPTTPFTLAPAAGNNSTQFASLSAVPSPLPKGTDEESAEAYRAPDENFAALKSEAPQLATAATPPQPVPAAEAPAVPMPNVPIPAIRPTPRPEPMPSLVAAVTPKAQQVAMATPTARPAQAAPALFKPATAKPEQTASLPPPPTLRPNIMEIDATGAPGHNWTIQVGALGNANLAEAQLNLVATKARDILGEAEHIVAPIQSSNGRTLYRARFGPYAEREARNVCSQLTQRGQDCIPVVAR